MRLALVALRKELALEWDEIDIDRDTDLIRQFDMLVPVLHFEGKEVCHYFIDEAAIRETLHRATSTSEGAKPD
jgi:thioredoxin reductase (NADPH)